MVCAEKKESEICAEYLVVSLRAYIFALRKRESCCEGAGAGFLSAADVAQLARAADL